jgi:putative transposase
VGGAWYLQGFRQEFGNEEEDRCPEDRIRGRRGEGKEALINDPDTLKELDRIILQEMLEGEMEEARGSGPQRADRRLGGVPLGLLHADAGDASGEVGTAGPQDRQGRFSTQLFERHQRSEKALVSALAEMYVAGVSTRKVKAITEELCGHAFSASTISAINQRLDEELEAFARRRPEEAYPYLILDARYERIRERGVVRRRAVLVAIGINWEGRRNILAAELANRETTSSWREFLEGLQQRGLHGVELVITDDHAGLREAVSPIMRKRGFLDVGRGEGVRAWRGCNRCTCWGEALRGVPRSRAGSSKGNGPEAGGELRGVEASVARGPK